MGKKIGVLGSGVVAQTLAKGFHAKGYETRIGSREASKLAAFSKESGIASGTFAEVAAFGEIVVLAVKGSVALEALKLVGEKSLRGRSSSTPPIPSRTPLPKTGSCAISPVPTTPSWKGCRRRSLPSAS